MTQKYVQVLLSGWIGLSFIGCLQSNRSKPSEPYPSEFIQESHVEVPRGNASPAYRLADGTEAPNEIEGRIAQRVERVLDGLPENNHPNRERSLTGRNLGSKKTVNPRLDRREDVDVSNRNETLRMSNSAGDLCAAVTIAPQLAVTALHCARALCESQSSENSASLNGCKIDFELATGATGVAKVVSTSDNDLLALLDLQRPLRTFGALYCDNPRATERVYTVSHPGGEKWMVSYGRLARDPIALEWVTGEATRVLVAEIPTKRGSSGGGLFDIQDRLVGVQIARWSPWTTDYGKAAFIQSNRIFNLAGRYCINQGSNACNGLRCLSGSYDIVSFDGYPGGMTVRQVPTQKNVK